MTINEMAENYLIANQKYFPAEKMVLLRQKVQLIDEKRFNLLLSVQLKDPTMLLVVSLFFGGLGVDRFMLGNIGIGVLKLLTFGLCYILTIIDWFLVSKLTRQYNYNAIIEIL